MIHTIIHSFSKYLFAPWLLVCTLFAWIYDRVCGECTTLHTVCSCVWSIMCGVPARGLQQKHSFLSKNCSFLLHLSCVATQPQTPAAGQGWGSHIGTHYKYTLLWYTVTQSLLQVIQVEYLNYHQNLLLGCSPTCLIWRFNEVSPLTFLWIIFA